MVRDLPWTAQWSGSLNHCMLVRVCALAATLSSEQKKIEIALFIYIFITFAKVKGLQESCNN